MDSLSASEALSARGATHPRVSLNDMEDAIAGEYTTTLDKAYEGAPILDSLKLMTIHTIVMRNGFVVIGKSAPASPENFDPGKGRTFAREDAIRQLWPLMGFSLRDQLWSDGEDARLLALPYAAAVDERRDAQAAGDAKRLARLDRLQIAVDAVHASDCALTSGARGAQ